MSASIAWKVERAVHRRLCYAARGGEWFAETPKECLWAIKVEADHFTARRPQAIEQLASNGRTVHLKGKRSGRKATAFDAAALKDAKATWRNVKDYPTWGDVAKALPEGFTTARAYKLFGKRL